MSAEETGSARPTCRCGFDRHHHMVSAQGRYTTWGWFCVLFGITTEPIRIVYRCRRCDQMFDETSEPGDLKGHI